MKSFYPQPLHPGDTLGIIAPAGQVKDQEKFAKAVSILQEMGFILKYPRELWPGSGYLSDSDSNRAEEFNRMWSDPEIKALIALRGGFGSLRILEKLDWEIIRTNPKLFIGFSDISLLLNIIYYKTGLISLHGPVSTSLVSASPATQERFFRCLTNDLRRILPIQPAKIEVLRDGPTTRAPLIGGNLVTLSTLLGTPWDFSYAGKILLLEDIGEPVYKIDRMLTQMKFSGKFKGLKGIILGDFHTAQENPEYDTISHLRYLESVWKLIIECSYNEEECPIWANFPIGHTPENYTVPIGAEIVMDTKNKSLNF